MNKKLINALNAMSENEFHQLELALKIASSVRGMKRDYRLSDEDCYVLFQIKSGCLQSYLNGGYPYTVLDLGTQQAVAYQLHSARATTAIEKEVLDMVRINTVNNHD